MNGWKAEREKRKGKARRGREGFCQKQEAVDPWCRVLLLFLLCKPGKHLPCALRVHFLRVLCVLLLTLADAHGASIRAATLSHMADPTPLDAFAGANLVSEAHEQLRVLQDAADALASTRTFDAEDRSAALAAAHKLGRVLEQSGVTQAGPHLQAIIATLDHPGLPQPERLQEQVAALAKLLFSGTAA